MGSIPTAPGIAGKSEKTISFLAFSCFIHDNKMLAERTFYCSSSFRALFFGCQPGGFFMEQKHTLEENGYYAQVTDQLIENIGYQMIRRNWSMKTLADKADLPYETVKHLMAGKIGRPSFISILKIANALECSLDDLAGRNNPALEALRRLADHADGMYQIFAEVEHLLYPNFMMQRENNK
ncbi:MAG: XRE family transcriptional regulator [Lachnospiraceae bacterium]|nr:XRE family transcriptional regulator [Lachnospiraceae bacterium]